MRLLEIGMRQNDFTGILIKLMAQALNLFKFGSITVNIEINWRFFLHISKISYSHPKLKTFFFINGFAYGVDIEWERSEIELLVRGKKPLFLCVANKAIHLYTMRMYLNLYRYISAVLRFLNIHLIGFLSVIYIRYPSKANYTVSLVYFVTKKGINWSICVSF